MSESLRILYVTSEITPFLNKLGVGDYVRPLPEAMQNKDIEIRIIVPRWGVINERKNRLHEVVRLSGINITVGEEDKPLTIKVASIPQAKMQVYFIDNEDYFHRKKLYKDKAENLFEDNDERAIFFCKGVAETVKKLGWAPDIVHCNDWFTGLLPLYLRTTYQNEPLFKESKIVSSVYDNLFEQNFDASTIADKVALDDITEEMLASLVANPTPQGFMEMGAKYSDCVVNAQESGKTNDIIAASSSENVSTIVGDKEAICDGYFEIYKTLLGDKMTELVEEEKTA
ncbi:glycogen/starch synthase [Bernardetia sp. ABR2-2B]|uniref:glycogen/starch synthase n=1 Tax=Bernardetia sp. ABR2-2B TaxID=3127472 RepID=UPI0030D41CEA